MSFFDAPASHGSQTLARHAPWRGPSDEVAGGIVPADQVLFTSHHVAVHLREIVAQPDGCLLEIQVTARRQALSEHDWAALGAGLAEGPRTLDEAGNPSKVMRFGVGLPDGSKATTLDERHDAAHVEPEVPYLVRWRDQARVATDEAAFASSRYQLWLWPLPPPEAFDLAIEWPGGGVPLTFAKLDGRIIHAAAQRSRRVWP